MLIFTLIITNLLIWSVPALVWLLSKKVAKLLKKKIYYCRFGLFSLALSLVWNLMLLYGYSFGRFRYEVKEIEYESKTIPEAFDGYRIVQISDFHIGGFENHEAFVDTLVSVINRQHPDLICFTGDFVSLSHEEAIPFIKTIRKLNARDGVVSVLGNHDYAVYQYKLRTEEEREADRNKLVTLQRDSMDWRLLLNEHFTIRHGNDSICIIGVENQACGWKQKVRRGDLRAAMQGTEGSFQVLLSHDPTHWDAEVLNQTDIQLTLSGHTHAMQFELFGWTPCSWFFKRSNGLYKEGEQCLYVNKGIGELMPFRIGATPEITVITLKR